MKKTLVLATMLVMVTTFSGCFKWAAEKAYEKAVENAIEADNGGDVDVDFDFSDGDFSYTDEEGNEMSFNNNASLPDAWPSEIPLKKNWEIFTSSTYTYDGNLDLSVSLMCDSCTSDEVVEYYRDALTDAGWTETGYFASSGGYGDSANIGFDNADGTAGVNVYYTESGEDTSITVGYTEYGDDWY